MCHGRAFLIASDALRSCKRGCVAHILMPPAADRVDSLDAQEKSSARPLAEIKIVKRRIGVADMQRAVGRRGESVNGRHANSFSLDRVPRLL